MSENEWESRIVVYMNVRMSVPESARGSERENAYVCITLTSVQCFATPDIAAIERRQFTRQTFRVIHNSTICLLYQV